MGDEDALPQRHNARRRVREQQQGEPGVATEHPAADPGGQEPEHAAGVSGCGASEDYADAVAANERSGDIQAQGAGPQEEEGEEAQQRDLEALAPYRSAAVGDFKFEYLDHTADVQLHAWGADLQEAFEQCGLAMFNYMSPLKHVRPTETRSYRAEGHDLQSLLFALLDELLFVFATELFLARRLTITAFDREAFVIEAEGRGETFDRAVHEVGTEIKAITYSAMSIAERPGDAEVFVIVDI